MGAIFGVLILIAVVVGGLTRPESVPQKNLLQTILDGVLIAYTVFVVAAPSACSTAVYFALAHFIKRN